MSERSCSARRRAWSAPLTSRSGEQAQRERAARRNALCAHHLVDRLELLEDRVERGGSERGVVVVDQRAPQAGGELRGEIAEHSEGLGATGGARHVELERQPGRRGGFGAWRG